VSDATTHHGQALLALLDATVRRDGGLSGLQGRVAVGVESERGVCWWSATFLRGRTETAFSAAEPLEAHARVLLGERRAHAWLGAGVDCAGDRLSITGSRALLQRFVTRYLEPKSVLDLRLQLAHR
jgi:hypothetical protein